MHAELIGQRLGHGWHRAVDTQGQGAVGRLAQWSWQHDRHALQVGLQTDFRHAVQHLDLQAITGLALQMLAQSHQFAHLLGITQALGRGNAVHTHLHRSRGGIGGRLHAALDAHITAQRSGLHARELKAGLRKLHIAAQLAECGHLGHQLQRIARQRHFTLYLAALHMHSGQMQSEAELGIARGLAAIQSMGSQRRQGRALNQVQHIAQGSMSLGVDLHLGQVPVGHSGLRFINHDGGMPQKALGLAHLHGVAVEHQLARQPGQRRPGLFARAQQIAGHKLVVHIMHLGTDVEFALARLFKRHMLELALDAEVHCTGLTRGDGLAHIAQRIAAQILGQIAINPFTLGAAELPLQIQQSRKARLLLGPSTGLPAGLGLAGRVLIGETQPGHLHLDGLALVQQLPAHQAVELVERNIGVFKHSGEAQHGLAGGRRLGKRCLAAVLVQAELATQPPHAGNTYAVRNLLRSLGTQAQLLEAPRSLVLRQLLQRSAP